MKNLSLLFVLLTSGSWVLAKTPAPKSPAAKPLAAKPSATQRADCLKNNGTDLVFPKDQKIQIADYDVASETYTIYSPELPAEGNSFVTLDTLIKGVKKVEQNQKDIRQKPDDIVDQVYDTRVDLPTLFPEERKARKACLHKQ